MGRSLQSGWVGEIARRVGVWTQLTNAETPKAMARNSTIRPRSTATPKRMTDIRVAGTARVTAYSGGIARQAERKTMGTPHRLTQEPQQPVRPLPEPGPNTTHRLAGALPSLPQPPHRTGTTAPAECKHGADLANRLPDRAPDRCRDLLGEPTDLRRHDVDLAVEDRYQRGQQAVPDRDDELDQRLPVHADASFSRCSATRAQPRCLTRTASSSLMVLEVVADAIDRLERRTQAPDP